MKYIRLRQQKFKKDKVGLSRLFLQLKSYIFAKQCGIPEDKWPRSSGWVTKVLNRNGLTGINLHGEGNDMNDDKQQELMNPRLTKFHKLIDDHSIDKSCVYNADQTGLYHRKLPNWMYVDKQMKKDYKGVKQMKDKDCVTIMVCTAADGEKCPLAMVGKSKNPHYFRLEEPPLPYTNQCNAWFTRTVTWWWIETVFWPWHLMNKGSVYCILLLDNCTAHNMDLDKIKQRYGGKLIIFFFPLNVTNKHQPADMGMIAAMKVGYRIIMLTKLLDIFEVDGGYEKAALARELQQKGCRGLDYGGKATILDAMKILNGIWSVDGKYAKKDSIRRCWRKAGILLVSWNCEINNDVSQLSNSMQAKDKQISSDDCKQLSELFKRIEIQVMNDKIGKLSQFSALTDSFADKPKVTPMTRADRLAMVEEWACVEDDPIVYNADIDDQIEALENDEEENDDIEEIDGDEESVVIMDMDDGDDGKQKAKVSFLEAEECCIKLAEYIKTSGAPKKNLDDIQRIARNLRLRSHHTSKPRTSPTLTHYFPKINK